MVEHLTSNQSNGRVARVRPVSLLSLAAALVIGMLAGAAGLTWLRTSAQPAPSELQEAKKSAAKHGIVEMSEEAQKNGGMATAPTSLVVLPTTIDLTGTVTPDDSRVAHIRPLARGLIEDVPVRLGDRVVKNQPLAVYDNIELGETIGEYLAVRAALRQAETDRDVKRAALERGEALLQTEAIARQTLEQRRAEFNNADAGVASVKARVSKVEEQIHRFGLSDADLAALRPDEEATPHRVVSHNVLRAPFDGVITKYDVAPGELVEPERELFTITNISTVWVLADLYERDLAKVQANTDATVRVESYPNREFSGRLTYVSDLIDPKTRTAKVRCVVPNPDGLLKLDMFAKITIPTRDRRQVLTVPIDAVQQVDGQSVVFVRRSPTAFERRDVTVGAIAGDRIEVSGSIGEGDAVVGKGSFYLKTALLREQIAED